MVAELVAATGEVDTVKVALVVPAGTVTLGGTLATGGLLLESVTVAPPAGAGPLRVTLPAEDVPPVTLDGLRAKEEIVTAGGGWLVAWTVRVSLIGLPANAVFQRRVQHSCLQPLSRRRWPGWGLAVAPPGNPLTLKLTAAVKPPEGVMLTVYVVPAPCTMVCEAGAAERLKSGAGLTVSVTNVVCVRVPLIPLMVNA